MATTTPRLRNSTADRGKARGDDTKIAYLMLGPALILLSIFVLWPLVDAWRVSFFQWSFYEASTFVGWDNFRRVLTDPDFTDSIWRGLIFAAIVVPAQMIIAFLFANLTKTMSKRMATVLKVSIYIPATVSFVIASIIFILIYQYRQGVLNWFLSFFGVDDQPWLGDASTALYAITVPAIWIGLGLASIIMLASLLDIPDSYYEAADLDGANWFQKTRYITIPMLKNITLFLSINGFVITLQQIDLPLIMTNGGPVDSTLLPNLLILNHFRNDTYVGYSIAAALLMFIVIGSISAVIFRLMPSEKAVDS